MARRKMSKEAREAISLRMKAYHASHKRKRHYTRRSPLATDAAAANGNNGTIALRIRVPANEVSNVLTAVMMIEGVEVAKLA